MCQKEPELEVDEPDTELVLSYGFMCSARFFFKDCYLHLFANTHLLCSCGTSLSLIIM